MLSTFPEVDELLRIIGLAAIITFTLYVIVTFIRVAIRDGLFAALITLISFRIILPLLLVIAINLLVVALVFIRPQQVGVVVSFLSPGGVRPQPIRGGLHLIIPFLERVHIYPIYWQTYTMSSAFNEGDKPGDDSIRARTNDGQEVRLDCSLIFRIDANQAVLVHIDWQERYREDLVRPLMRGIVRRQASQFNVDEVNSESRRDLEAGLERILREELAQKGFILDQFVLRDIAFTPQYALAVEEKQVSLEEQLRAQYQAERMRELARGQADAVVIQAQGMAEGLDLIAGSLEQNRDLLTYRYIEKLAPNIRVMLVPSNTPLILPLPELTDIDALTPTTSLTPTTMLGQPPSESGPFNLELPNGIP